MIARSVIARSVIAGAVVAGIVLMAKGRGRRGVKSIVTNKPYFLPFCLFSYLHVTHLAVSLLKQDIW